MKICFMRHLLPLLFVAISVPSWAQESWPTFRGSDRTGVSKETNLLKSWPDGGPELLWTASGAGRGYATVAIAGGRFYTLGDGPSTASDNDEYLSCFDLATGKQIWSVKTGPAWNKGQPTWQGSRSTPTVDGDRVYVVTPFGKLICLNTDGNEIWQRDLKEDLGGQKADSWGYSESVLIDGDRLICTPGGPTTTLAALNKMTGQTIWTTPSPDDRGAGHASVVISNVGGRKVYVQVTGSGALAVDASDGKLLWTYGIKRTTSVIPTAIVKDDLVFFTAGYGTGGTLVRQVPDGSGGIDAEEVYPTDPRLGNKHGGLILVDGYLYGDAGDRGVPMCVDLETGEVMWKSRGSGKKSASITSADGMLYILFSDGTMVLANASPSDYEEVSTFKIPGGDSGPSWAHPVVFDGKLFVRQGDNVLCYNLRARA